MQHDIYERLGDFDTTIRNLEADTVAIRQALQELLQAAEGALEFEKNDLFSPIPNGPHPLTALETAIQNAKRFA